MRFPNPRRSAVPLFVFAFAFAAVPIMTPGAEAAEKDTPPTRDVVFATLDTGPLQLDLYLPKDTPHPPLVVFVHGGGWRNNSYKKCLTPWLTEHGFAVASVGYRLVDKATFPAQIHDVKGAVRWLRAHAKDYGYDASRIGVAGTSAGGHLATLLGVTAGDERLEGDVGGNLDRSAVVQCVVNYYGPMDFVLRSQNQPSKTEKPGSPVRGLLGGPASKNLDAARLASPAFHVTRDDPPLLTVHGRKDTTVKPDQAERIEAEYRKRGLDVTTEWVPEGGHGGKVYFNDKYRNIVAKFLRKHLVTKPRADGGDAKTAEQMKPYTQDIPATGVRFDMLPIPAGVVTMGSPPDETDRKADEGPQVRVQVEPFWMGRYEVTWGEFREFYEQYGPAKLSGVHEVVNPGDLSADAVSIPTPIWPQEGLPYFQRMGMDDTHPATAMTQYSARQFTKWLRAKTGRFYRLPTEAEWEHACRAGTTSAYYFGDDPAALKQHAWYFDNSEWPEEFGFGHPDYGDAGYRVVGKLKPNPWGLHDMYGNVCEWVIDQHDPQHYARLAKKPQPVHWRDAINWPTSQWGRVTRGGSWDSDSHNCRSATRVPSIKEWQELDPQLPKSIWWHTEFFMGLRVVRPLREPSDQEKRRFWDDETEHIREVLEENKKQVRIRVKP